MTAGDITVETFDQPLAAVRRVLDGADEALLGVAFVQQRGVNLVGPQLAEVADARVVCTSGCAPATAPGPRGPHATGLRARVLTPRHGPFHPKVYLARRGTQVRAAVG